MLALLFTIAFEYFGRPALVVEGDFNTRSYVFFSDMTSYSLGRPKWGFGRVTYPLTGYESMTPCTGYVSLVWEWPVGWTEGDGSLSCPP